VAPDGLEGTSYVCLYHELFVVYKTATASNMSTINIANPGPLYLLACSGTHRACLQIDPGVMLHAHK